VNSQNQISNSYTLYSYTITGPTTVTQNFAVAENLANGAVGVGIGYDNSTGKLVLIDNRNNGSGLDYVNPSTGAITPGPTITGLIPAGPATIQPLSRSCPGTARLRRHFIGFDSGRCPLSAVFFALCLVPGLNLIRFSQGALF